VLGSQNQRSVEKRCRGEAASNHQGGGKDSGRKRPVRIKDDDLTEKKTRKMICKIYCLKFSLVILNYLFKDYDWYVRPKRTCLICL
jgi:hypothetical protein